jgi:hypothetical protein
LDVDVGNNEERPAAGERLPTKPFVVGGDALGTFFDPPTAGAEEPAPTAGALDFDTPPTAGADDPLGDGTVGDVT